MHYSQCLRGTVKITATSNKHARVPSYSRWKCRLASATVFNRPLDLLPSLSGHRVQLSCSSGAMQLSDERHMSPEFNSFIGHHIRDMTPGREGIGCRTEEANQGGAPVPIHPANILAMRLPNQTHIELTNRRDVPHHHNLMFGKLLYDKTVHGTSMPYYYRLHKDMQGAARNDKKLHIDKYRVITGQGMNNPPPGFEEMPEPEAEESSETFRERFKKKTISGGKRM